MRTRGWTIFSAALITGLLTLTLAATPTPAVSTPPAPSSPAPRVVAGAAGARAAAMRLPRLRVTRVVGRLDIPWDVKPLRAGRLLITERTTTRLLTWRKGKLRRVAYASSTVWTGGETGLMGLAVDPAFARNRRFYTCQGGRTAGGGHDVRVMAWVLGRKAKRAFFSRALVTGIPSTSGRHGGCRLLIAGGALYVGTGDAAAAGNSRNLGSLGGKTLRLNRFTGAPWPTNPFIGSTSRNARYVLTYGHRNVQGLALRSDGSLWSVEHGPDRDDEVNRLVTGGDYGWDPRPPYDESVPMTDQSLPGNQIEARWRSGATTIATSGAAWVRGSRWGAYEGTLAVAALKGSRVVFMRFDRAGRYVSSVTPPALRRYGRLRSVTNAPNGDLLVTTSNATGRDAVLRVSPVG